MAINKKSILIIDNALGFTGAFKSIFSVVQKLDSQYRFIFCIPTASALKRQLSESGTKYITLPFVEVRKSLSLIFYLPMLLYNALRLVAATSRHKIDIIHVNDLYNMTGIIVKILKPKITLVHHVRLMPGSYAKALYPLWIKLILKFADHVICCSFAVQKGLKSESEKIQVIYDMPPLQEKHPVQKQSNNQVTLLYLSNFTPGKGHNFAIEAFAAVRQQFKDVRMIMAGGDLGMKKNMAYKKTLMTRVRQLGIAPFVLFDGFEPDVEKRMREATIFLNFSESESFSMTCLEALFYGIPLIATDCGGPAELFENGKSGLLVKNRDLREMENAILRLCRNRELRAELSANGKAFVRAKFRPEDIINRYNILYER